MSDKMPTNQKLADAIAKATPALERFAESLRLCNLEMNWLASRFWRNMRGDNGADMLR